MANDADVVNTVVLIKSMGYNMHYSVLRLSNLKQFQLKLQKKKTQFATLLETFFFVVEGGACLISCFDCVISFTKAPKIGIVWNVPKNLSGLMCKG